MKLIPDAGKVAKRASSMWLIYGGVALQAAAEVAPYLMDAVPGGGWLRIAAIVVTAGAGVARLVKQEDLHNGQ